MKRKTGKECKKTECKRHESYSAWDCWSGNSDLEVCMDCKWAYVSQFEKKPTDN